MITLTAPAAPPLSRTTDSQRLPLRVALVQHRWRPDTRELVMVLRDGIDRAVANGIFVHASLYEHSPAADGLGFNTAILFYPTAIGSEPVFPDFDTRPLWQQVIVANGINSGLFMVVPNRVGDEGAVRFYGSSFISDPYGRVLVQAPRDQEAVLVADLDLDQRRDWLALFPFLLTRRPDTYDALTNTVDTQQPYGAGQQASAVVK